MRFAVLLPLLWLVLVGFISYLFIPMGLRFLSNADKGSPRKPPLVQGQVLDIAELPDASGHQYVVSFVDAAQKRARGFTQVIKSKPRYTRGDIINMYIVGLQSVFPGSEPSSTPTYDVELYDGITFAYDVQFRKLVGWLLVGIPGVFILATIGLSFSWLLW